MMNKKLIALLVAIVTANTSMFALIDDVLRTTGRATEGFVNAPRDIATGGETRRERHDRYKKEDAERRQQERARRSDDQYYRPAVEPYDGE